MYELSMFSDTCFECKLPVLMYNFHLWHAEKKIKDVSNGDVLDDSYHRYKEDIGIMKYMNLDAYRFSISWSRVLPKGKLSAGVNHEGVNYYNNLINELMANGLQPYVSLFHWDVPQALEDEYGGFLSPHIVVKHWITLNEPRSVSKNGYANGRFAPGRCSDWLKLNCTGSDSRIEPYLTLHYQLLAHAATAKLYKTKYQEVTPWFADFHSQNEQSRCQIEDQIQVRLIVEIISCLLILADEEVGGD
ncbi:hypothetical protein AAZV13_12G093833 [Glycine max]